MTHLLRTEYGSHLYGTNTPTSDLDEKVVYLPNFTDVLLGRKLKTFKMRYDAGGHPVADNLPMPDNGLETEFVPFQTFCRDFLNGQTYALEVAFACLKQPDPPQWLHELVGQFLTCNVSSMAGFAMKQTFDYVHRGRRLEKALALQKAIFLVVDWLEEEEEEGRRLDTMVSGKKVLHHFADMVGLDVGSTFNNNRTLETLKLNGRLYLETTALEHFETAVRKLVDSYGDRSAAAMEHDVDRKSLMHAVRVYQQALELLQSGAIEFPRPNREELLRVKTDAPLEEVKDLLLSLEQALETAMETAKVLPEKTEALEVLFDDWLYDQLRRLYLL